MTTWMVVLTGALAGQAGAAPPAGLAPALKAEIGTSARAVFGGARNRAYSVEELRGRVQAGIEAQRASVLRKALAERASGLRERVLEEAEEFLADLSLETDRLAREAKGVAEFQTNLRAIETHVAAWSGSAQGRAASIAAAGALPPTEADIEGPFYRPNAPFTSDLTAPGAQGAKLNISGRVLGTDGAPLAGAVVDVWLADPAGAYDIDDPADRQNPAIPYRFRGRMSADAQGRYSFTTLQPGQYEIGEGKWRPRHVHFKVSAPGRKAVTTQLYFEGDPYNAVDPWWKRSNTIAVVDSGSALAGIYDVVLANR